MPQKSTIILKLAWWCMSIMLALRRLRQEDLKSQTSVGYIARSCLKAETLS
jgi:hypothetical protein